MFPVRARLLSVTQKVSSNSIHTLLCSVEHKNPPSDGFGRIDFNHNIKPSDSSCRLDAKPRLPRRLFKNKTAKCHHSDNTTPFPAEAIQPIFSYRRNQCTTIELDSRIIRAAYARRSVPTLVGCDVGLLGEISSGSMALHGLTYPPSVPTIVGKSGFSMRPARRQIVPNRRHKLPRKRKRRQRAQVWLHLPRTQNMVYGSSNYRKENL